MLRKQVWYSTYTISFRNVKVRYKINIQINLSIELLTTHNYIYIFNDPPYLKSYENIFSSKKYTTFCRYNTETIGISLGDILSFVTGLRNVCFSIGFEKQITV